MNTREHPQYSIIIPHFNSPHKLRRLLLSIPERDDLQIVVVDDTSTKMISEFEALKHEFSYVEFYSTVINGGGGKARNIGLDHATGNKGLTKNGYNGLLCGIILFCMMLNNMPFSQAILPFIFGNIIYLYRSKRTLSGAELTPTIE